MPVPLKLGNKQRAAEHFNGVIKSLVIVLVINGMLFVFGILIYAIYRMLISFGLI